MLSIPLPWRGPGRGIWLRLCRAMTAATLGRTKVGIAQSSGSFGFCLRFLARQGDATLGLYAGRKVLLAPTEDMLHGRGF